jgi:hypothetical protein
MIPKLNLVKVYKRENVTIIVQWQGTSVVVSRRKLISPAIVRHIPLPDDFSLIRPVINIDLHLRSSSTPLISFNPPIEMHVRYTRADLAAAREHNKPLRLGYYYEIDKNQWQWFFFTQEKHQIEDKPDPNPDNGGEWVVYISHWGDPMIGWGA